MALPGKVALITGSGRNIGRSIGLELARGFSDWVCNEITLTPLFSLH